MKHPANLTMKNEDFQKISALLASAPPQVQELLQAELDRASVTADDALPGDVVAMHSTVVYKDRAMGTTSTVTLVYPHEADIAQNRISILAPVGAALIGLKVGQSITWPLPGGRSKEVEVLEVFAPGQQAS